MALWFECRVRYDKMQENGTVKKVTEPYLVDALTFTEAEARTIEAVTPYISGEFTIPAIKKTTIAEIFPDDGCDKWWLVKYNIITLNEKSGKERKTAVLVMVQANDQQGATDRFIEGMKGTLADWEIEKVAETKIVEVIPIESSSSL